MAYDLHVQCTNCGEFKLTDNHANPDSALTCRPGAGCCAQVHDHDATCAPDCAQIHDHAAAANACPGGHDAEPCPFDPDNCPVFAGGTGSHGPTNVGHCPGGHCGKDVKGCTVCRPVTITGLRGLIGTLQPFGGGLTSGS